MNLKDYFDVSSIHGFGHVNGQTSFGKIFWLFVVTSGFVFAGVLVGQSFESWRSNPISTVIETKPILESKFPDVVVCPPENTFTNLNLDLMNADNIVLDEKLRESLVNRTTEMILDEEFFSAYADQNDVLEGNKYKNWYTGFTLASLSYSKLVQVSTSSESGSFSSPFYGKPFKANKFQIEADYEILISPPKNISRFRSGKGYDNLCVEINKDTSDNSIKEVKETVKWYQGYSFGQLLDGFQTETRCFKGKDFKQSITRARYVKLAFYRVFSKRAFEVWKNKRFTGMNVSWYYTDSEGQKIKIVPEPKYLNEEANQIFITLVRLVENHQNGDLWRKLKRFKVDIVNNESFKQTESCEFSTSETTSTFKLKQISLFLGEIIEEQGLENTTEPLNPEEATLDVAAAMFTYLAQCPSQITKDILIDQLKRLYRTASTATIWEAIINIYKNSLTKKPKSIHFPTDAVENMISIIGEKLNSTLALLEALSLSKEGFRQNVNENILFKSLTGEVRECLEDNNFCLQNSLSNIIKSTLLGSHPVHISSEAPSSFIPFCSLGGNMTAVGKIFPNFLMPVCSSFEPFLLNDQVVVNCIL